MQIAHCLDQRTQIILITIHSHSEALALDMLTPKEDSTKLNTNCVKTFIPI